MKILRFGEKNVGLVDRAFRIMSGFVLIFCVFFLRIVSAPGSYLVVFIGIIALVTGALGTCAVYSLFGINTLDK